MLCVYFVFISFFIHMARDRFSHNTVTVHTMINMDFTIYTIINMDCDGIMLQKWI